jgi:hypothetical protein
VAGYQAKQHDEMQAVADAFSLLVNLLRLSQRQSISSCITPCDSSGLSRGDIAAQIAESTQEALDGFGLDMPTEVIGA